MEVIDDFSPKTGNHFLSNFYMGDATLKTRLYGYASTEHFYQAMKTTDPTRRVMIMAADTPGTAKSMGNARAHVLRPGWDEGVKDQIMAMALALKFAPGTELSRKLMLTGDARLIEGNYWHDTYWGICNGQCKGASHKPYGLNKLGLGLMFVRNLLLCQPS